MAWLAATAAAAWEIPELDELLGRAGVLPVKTMLDGVGVGTGVEETGAGVGVGVGDAET